MYLTIRLKKVLAICLACLCVCLAGGVIWRQAMPAAAETAEGVQVPIIMYHGMLKDQKQQGKYVIDPDLFESDLKYLKEQGYNTVVMQDLIDYVKKGKALPDKPIMLSFDDGYLNNFLYAYPLLRQYESKMVFAPIGRFVDEYSEMDDRNPIYALVTWSDIKDMMDSGLVEVQNHTYNMHTTDKGRKGSMRKKGESEETYRQVLMEDVGKLQSRMQEMTGYTPTTFVYPFGAISKEALPILKEMGFQATLSCESRINTLTDDPNCLYGLGRFRRPNSMDSKTFFTKTVKLP